MLLKSKEREVEIIENLMTAKFDVSILLLSRRFLLLILVLGARGKFLSSGI
jgi:hypothetical protein